MDQVVIERAITDHAAGVLLRYFAGAAAVELQTPSILLARDRELLRLHWALSPAVTDLVEYVLAHRHEIQSILTTVERLEDGIVRGRLDAVATLRHRRMSGHASAVVSHEPLRTFDSGPNHVLGWVIGQAWSLASRFSLMTLDSPSYRLAVDRSLQQLEQARRLQAIQRISGQGTLAKRPGANALTLAERSRRLLYRKAANAYRFLLAIEAGQPDAISSMLRKTLLAPLEPWRRYELMVGYCVAEALADAEDSTMNHLNIFVGDVRKPLARVGRYAVYWQWGPNRRDPSPEPSEVIMQRILDAYDIRKAGDRPDLVVYDVEASRAAGLVEVKYLTAEDATDRIRSAASQIVRYARSYRDLDDAESLLGSSLIAVSQGMERIPDPVPVSVPFVVDFDGIRRQRLRLWAHRLLTQDSQAAPVPPEAVV